MFLLSAMIVITQSLIAQTNVRPQDVPAKKERSQDFSLTDSDRVINARIRDRLKQEGLQGYDSIAISTKNGDVEVSGTVQSSEDAEKVLSTIRATDGVNAVFNRIVVENR